MPCISIGRGEVSEKLQDEIAMVPDLRRETDDDQTKRPFAEQMVAVEVAQIGRRTPQKVGFRSGISRPVYRGDRGDRGVPSVRE